MAVEIERKFLVRGAFRKDAIHSRRIIQGYICSVPERTVRIRISGTDGFLTIKGPTDSSGMSRYEFETKISMSDAEELFKLCERGAIAKERFWVPVGERMWEVDVFYGANEGLILAEIELSSEDEEIELPEWVGEEVTGDKRFYNSSLTTYPYRDWKNK